MSIKAFILDHNGVLIEATLSCYQVKIRATEEIIGRSQNHSR